MRSRTGFWRDPDGSPPEPLNPANRVRYLDARPANRAGESLWPQAASEATSTFRPGPMEEDTATFFT
jgi:hypothetical protein